jgi:hypothetical protein
MNNETPPSTSSKVPDFKALARMHWKHTGWELSVSELELMARYGELMHRLGQSVRPVTEAPKG